MSKLAIFSDLHIHPFPAFGRPDENGVNRRLSDLAATLRQILKSAEQAKCEAVLFSGDWFHTKSLGIETLDETARALSSSDIPIYGIAGNHDEARKLATMHSLRAFNRRIRILDTIEGNRATVGGFDIAGIPYHYYREDLNKALDSLGRKPDILLMHTGFSGALMGADFILDSPDQLSISEGFDRAGLVLSGHFHQPQLFTETDAFLPTKDKEIRKVIHGKTILIPGAPVQHGFGDQGSVRGFWIYNGDSLQFNRLTSIEFIESPVSKACDPSLKGKYVTFKAKDEAELRAFHPPVGVADCTIGLVAPETPQSGVRVEINSAMPYKAILEAYIKHHKPDGDEILLAVGRQIIEDVSEGS